MQIDTTSLVSIGMSLTSWIFFLAFVVKVSMRFGALELKVDTMWGFQMRRAMTEIVQTGGATKNSPLQIPDDALRALDGVKERLQLWYSKQNSQSDATLMLVIEQEFGDDLVNIVCIPCKVSYGACLIMALAVAKNQNPLQLNLTVAQDSKGR